MEDDYLTLITTGIKRPPEERWKYVDVRRSLLHRQFHIMDKNLEGSKMMYRELANAGIISEYERDAIEHCNGSERGRKFLEALMKKDDTNTLTFLTQCKEGKYGKLLATLATDMFESELLVQWKFCINFVCKIKECCLCIVRHRCLRMFYRHHLLPGVSHGQTAFLGMETKGCGLV